MAVTSIRSFGSRASRIEIERGFRLVDDGGLVPCICKTPCREIRCRHIRRNTLPRPLITPEIGLVTRDRRKAYRDQQIAACRRRGLGEIISAEKSRLSQILRDVSQSDNSAPVAGQRPDINSRYFLVRPRQKLAAWIFQIDIVEQKRIMPPAIEIQERYSAQQVPRTFKSKNRLRIVAQKLRETGFRGVDPGNFPSRNRNQIDQLPTRRQTDGDCGGRRKPVQLMSSGEIATFSKQFLHLSSPYV